MDDGEQIEVKVYVQEFSPFAEGDPSTDEELALMVNNLAKIAVGNAETTVTTSSHILATYFETQPYFKRPNIHAGEQLLILSIGDTTDFLWVPLEHDHAKRKHERMHMLVANKNDTTSPLTEGNAYSVLVDTRPGSKKVEISTNKNDGEQFAYKVLIDVMASKLMLADDAGNSITLDSNAQSLTLKNAAGDSANITPGTIELVTSTFIAPNIESVEGMTTFTGGVDIGMGATVELGVTGKLPYTCPMGVTHKP